MDYVSRNWGRHVRKLDKCWLGLARPCLRTPSKESLKRQARLRRNGY